jgi:hypothetical protein
MEKKERKEKIKRVIDFDEQFEKWFEVKKKRYNIIKMKWYYSIYDHIKFDTVKDFEGDMYMYEEEEEARKQKNKMNAEWEKKLITVYSERKKHEDIWDPMFILSDALK